MKLTKKETKTKEVNQMRKTLMVVFLALLSVVLVSGYASAITGQCGSCHTMHNSQDGDPVDAAGPNDNLTKFACLGCHSGSIGAAPNIFGELAAARTAGGTFNDNIIDADSKAHNVVDLNDAGMLTVGLESTITATPGNSVNSLITLDPDELNCAGATGCHGDHDVGNTTSGEGIKGYHHNAPTKGYRFLETNEGTPTIINGKGSSTWELGGATTANHNVYDGDTDDSISVLCQQCHGGFHGSAQTGSSSPFQRHPTDEEAVIANIDGTGFTVDNTIINETPFGFTNAQVTGMVTTDITTGTAYESANGKAICVSCHRAHGSDYSDLLRFDYSSMSAGDSTNDGGCETCHTAQR